VTTTSELPDDLRERAASMLKDTAEAVAAHSQLRLENATYLIRRLMLTATGIGVDVRGWYDRDGGVDLSEVRDHAGRLLWRHGDGAPAETTTDQPGYRLRWQRLLADIENELAAALDFSTPSECGWEELELGDADDRPYWIELPGGAAPLSHKVAT
jgi:hypothetical protein